MPFFMKIQKNNLAFGATNGNPGGGDRPQPPLERWLITAAPSFC